MFYLGEPLIAWAEKYLFLKNPQGGLISELFSLLLKSRNKCAKSHSWAPSVYVDIAQECDLAPLLGDLSQSEKLSEIKPPFLLSKSSDSKTLW